MATLENDTVDMCALGHNASYLTSLNITCPESTDAGGWIGDEYIYLPYVVRMRLAKNVLFYLLWIVGIVGNILCLIVLSRKTYKNTSSGVYMRSLAVSDIIALCGYGIREISEGNLLDLATDWYCRTTFFCIYYGGMTSGWLVLFMSAERFVAVTWPLKAGTLCTKTRAVIATVVIYIVSCGLNLHLMFTFKAQTLAGSKYCDLDNTFEKFHAAYFPLQIAFQVHIPAYSIFVLNIMIIVQLARARKTQKAMTTGENSNEKRTSDQKGKGNQSNQITVMLVVVSVIFWITTTPTSIYTLILDKLLEKPYSPSYYGSIVICQMLFDILLIFNHAINFVLYCLSGKKFRSELLMVILCKERKQGPTSTNTYLYSQSNMSTVASTVPSRAVSASQITTNVDEKTS